MKKTIKYLKTMLVTAVLAFTCVYIYKKHVPEIAIIPNLFKEETIVGNYLIGSMATKENDMVTARKRYERALDIDPENEELQKKYVKALIVLGHTEEALAYIHQRLDKKERQDPIVATLIAMSEMKQQKYQQAYNTLKEIEEYQSNLLQENMNSIMVKLLIAWTFVGQGQYDQSLSWLETKLEPYLLAASPFLIHQKALLLDAAGKTEQAQKLYEKSIELTNIPYHFVKTVANFYHRIGESDKAQELLANFAKQNPTLGVWSKRASQQGQQETPERIIKTANDGAIEVLLEMFRLSLKTDQEKEGLVILQLAKYLAPQNEQTQILLAAYYEKIERYKEALKIYQDVQEASDFYWIAQTNIAMNLYQLGYKGGAKRRAENVSKEINDPSAVIAYADLLRQDKEYRKALTIYQKVVSNIAKPEVKHWFIYFAKGICHERLGEWDQAEQELLTALELKPGQPEVLNYLGYSWIDLDKNIEEAQTMIMEALSKRPGNVQITDSMGWALYKLGDYHKASMFLERALETLPYDPVLNDHLGDIYWRLNRTLEAKYQWQRAIENANEDLNIQTVENKLLNGLPAIESPQEHVEEQSVSQD